jgi:hypothetical protein
MKVKLTLYFFLFLFCGFSNAQYSTAVGTVLISAGNTVNDPYFSLINFMVYNGYVEALSQSYTTGVYTNSAKSITGRDGKGNLTGFFNYYYNSGSWANQDSDNYVTTYDANQRITSLWQSSKGSNPGSTKATMVYNVGYNASGKPVYINYTDTFSSGTPPDQVSIWVDSIEYNGLGKITKRSSYIKGTGGTYQVPANFTEYYEYSGTNLTGVLSALTAFGDTAKMSKIVYEYDGQNRMTRFSTFAAVNYLQYKDSLYEFMKRSFQYDGNGKLDKIDEQRYSGSGLQSAYFYDAFVLQNGNRMRSVRRTDVQGGFADSSIYFLNAAGNPDSVQIYFGIGGGSLLYRGHILFTYTPTIPTAIEPVANAITFYNYPNPATETITVVSAGSGSYQLLTLMGTEVLSGKLEEGKTDLNVAPVNRGMYLLVSKTNGQMSVQKILLQ